MTSGNPVHVLALLDQAFRGAKKVLEAEVPPVEGLRPSHFRLLDYTPAEGIRLTELSRRANVTKQALGEFVTALEGAGLLQVTPDPTDGRARLVALTAQGRRVRHRIHQTVAGIERDLRNRVGEQRWSIFREVLEEMAAAEPARG
jgi:DNA-binding MarR family transcriptional regulator